MAKRVTVLCLVLVATAPSVVRAHVTCATDRVPSVGVIAEPPAPREHVCTTPLSAGTRSLNIAWSAEARGYAFLDIYDGEGALVGEVWCSVPYAPEFQCGARLPEGSSTRVGSAIGATMGLSGFSARVPFEEAGDVVFSVAAETLSVLCGPWTATRAGTFELSVD